MSNVLLPGFASLVNVGRIERLVANAYRLRKEHPGEEDTVIMRGRIQGGLQPTRAFGDASYKWTHEEAAR